MVCSKPALPTSRRNPLCSHLLWSPHEAEDRSARRRRYRPRSHPRSHLHPARSRGVSAGTISSSSPPSLAAWPSPKAARPCRRGRSKLRSRPTPSCWARSATISSTTCRPTSVRKPACSTSARPSAASPTCVPCLAFAPLAENSPLRPEVTQGVDILFVRELLGGLYFGEPRWWNRDSGEAINTMRYTQSRSRPRRSHRLRARRQSAAASSPRSTKPTSSSVPSSGAPPSTNSRPSTPASRSSTSSSIPWPSIL